MEENTRLPAEVVERILKARDALVVGDRDEAYHQLYAIASPKFDKYSPWEEMEKQVGHVRLNEQDIINSKEVTTYATKLHQFQEQYDEERQFRVHLEKENDVITANYNQLQLQSEELKTKVANLGACLVLCSDLIDESTFPELMGSIKKYLKTYKIKDLDGE